MFTPTTVLVRRTGRTDLSMTSPITQGNTATGAVVLQMLFSELASMKQQLNAIATRPSSLQLADPPRQRSFGPEQVKPSRLRNIFD